jgi:hypothetical protein
MLKINPDTLRVVIDYLVARYPNELPRSVTTLEQLHMKIGEQHVIQTLAEWAEYLEHTNGKS